MISKEEVLENSNDKDFVLKAIEETPTLIEFASDELRDDNRSNKKKWRSIGICK